MRDARPKGAVIENDPLGFEADDGPVEEATDGRAEV